MTQEELDKLAEKYQDDNTIIRYYGPGNGSVPEYNKTMEEVFKDGWNACKEQMMKEAVEAQVIESFNPVTTIGEPTMHGCTIVYEDKNKSYLVAGDKPHIIIVKEDEK